MSYKKDDAASEHFLTDTSGMFPDLRCTPVEGWALQVSRKVPVEKFLVSRMGRTQFGDCSLHVHVVRCLECRLENVSDGLKVELRLSRDFILTHRCVARSSNLVVGPLRSVADTRVVNVRVGLRVGLRVGQSHL